MRAAHFVRRFNRPNMPRSISLPEEFELMMFSIFITELCEALLAGAPDGLPLGGGVLLSRP